MPLYHLMNIDRELLILLDPCTLKQDQEQIISYHEKMEVATKQYHSSLIFIFLFLQIQDVEPSICVWMRDATEDIFAVQDSWCCKHPERYVNYPHQLLHMYLWLIYFYFISFLFQQYGHFFPDPQYMHVQHINCCDSFATYSYDFEFEKDSQFSR
jgi:dolichol kinase